MKDTGENFQYHLATLLYSLVSRMTMVIQGYKRESKWSEMKPQLNFRAPGSILGITNLNFGPLELNIHYFSSFLSYIYPVSRDFLKEHISGLKFQSLHKNWANGLRIITCDIM